MVCFQERSWRIHILLRTQPMTAPRLRSMQENLCRDLPIHAPSPALPYTDSSFRHIVPSVHQQPAPAISVPQNMKFLQGHWHRPNACQDFVFCRTSLQTTTHLKKSLGCVEGLQNDFGKRGCCSSCQKILYPVACLDSSSSSSSSSHRHLEVNLSGPNLLANYCCRTILRHENRQGGRDSEGGVRAKWNFSSAREPSS